MKMRKTYNPVKQVKHLNKQQLDSVKFFGPAPSADVSGQHKKTPKASTQSFAQSRLPHRFINDWEINEK